MNHSFWNTHLFQMDHSLWDARSTTYKLPTHKKQKLTINVIWVNNPFTPKTIIPSKFISLSKVPRENQNIRRGPTLKKRRT